MEHERSAAINIGGCEYEMILTTKATREIAARYGGLENLGDKLSDLGKMIDDQPKTELPKEISEYVEYLRAVKGK